MVIRIKNTDIFTVKKKEKSNKMCSVEKHCTNVRKEKKTDNKNQ